MHNGFLKLKPSAFIGLLAVLTICAPGPTYAQDQAKPLEVKYWPAQGSWRTTLLQRPTGDLMCMVNALGKEPHAFGVSIIETPGSLMFAIDDRNSTQGYLPTMAVQIDKGTTGIHDLQRSANDVDRSCRSHARAGPRHPAGEGPESDRRCEARAVQAEPRWFPFRGGPVAGLPA